MKFLTAVALVMLWVPVDASGQGVTIEAVSQQVGALVLHRDGGQAEIPDMTFESRNNTSRTIVAWRGHLEIRSPFGELIWEGDLMFGEHSDLLSGETVRSKKRMDHANTKSGFNLLDYQATDLELIWTDVQVAYSTDHRLQPPPRPENLAYTPYTVAPSILNRNEVVQAIAREYPGLLRDAGIGGTVRVYFFIDEEGEVQDTRIDQSSGYQELDDAALSVSSVYRFSPALNRDRRLPVWVSFPITFQVR